MKRLYPAAALCLILAATATGRADEVDRAKRAEELKNLKFGMFIPWGFQHVLGKDESIGVKDLSLFNPTGCDIDQWVSVGKEAGNGLLRLLCQDLRRVLHVGHKNNRSQSDQKPLGRDVIADARRACDKHGVKFAITYEEGDWTWPGAIDGGADWPAPPRGQVYPSGLIAGIPQAGGNNPEVKKGAAARTAHAVRPRRIHLVDTALGDGGLDHKTTADIRKKHPARLPRRLQPRPTRRRKSASAKAGAPSALNDPNGAGINKKQKGMQDYKGYLLGEFVMPMKPARRARHAGTTAGLRTMTSHAGYRTSSISTRAR